MLPQTRIWGIGCEDIQKGIQRFINGSGTSEIVVPRGSCWGPALVGRGPFLGLSVVSDQRGQNTTDHSMWGWAKESMGLVDWLCDLSGAWPMGISTTFHVGSLSRHPHAHDAAPAHDPKFYCSGLHLAPHPNSDSKRLSDPRPTHSGAQVASL